MAGTLRKKVLVFLLLLSLTGAIGLGVYSYLLIQDKNALSLEMDELDKRARLLQRKYAEEKRQAQELLRVKSRLEGQNRVSQADLDKLEQQKQDLAREIESLKTAQARLEAEVEKLISTGNELRKELKGVQVSYRQVVEDFHADLVRVVDANQELERKLNRKVIEIEQCMTNNAALCDISQELVMKYRNKGVIGSFAEKEPLTQIKKVALEEYIQEYADKIDGLKIRESVK